MVVRECEDLIPSSVGYQPWLIQLPGRKKDKQEFMNPYDHRTEERKIPEFEGKLCLGCFGEWVLLVDESTIETFFLHLTLNPELTVRLPSLRGESFKYLGGCVVSSPPTSRRCMVTYVRRRSNDILYCRPNVDASWTKVSLPIDLQSSDKFTGQVVTCNGVIYALHGCGVSLAARVVVINEESLLSGDFMWTDVNLPDVIDFSYWCHLVVSGENIFLVSVVISDYRGSPTNYTIHLLETSDLSWKQVESIGGRAFFLGGTQSAALSATQAGMHHDCIFVLNLNYPPLPDKGIYRICMQDQTVSLSLLLKRPKDKIWYKLCWIMPTRYGKSKNRILSLSHSIATNKCNVTCLHKEKMKEENCKTNISSPWADMPIELVQLLLPRLSLVDCIRLPSVCKPWSSLSNPTQEANVNPWLMYSKNDCSLWWLFDPVYGKEYSVDMTWLGISKGLDFHYSKDGWVLASKEDYSLLLINPLTRESLNIPNFDSYCPKKSLAFSSAPTSSDCVVFIAEFTDDDIFEISTWSPGEEAWRRISFHDDQFSYYVCKPVFTRGEFYCYSIRGELLVFNPYKRTREVIELEAPIEMVQYRGRVMECYLVGSGEDLITVFRGSKMDPIRIFKLDRLNMVWSEQDDMSDVTIFLNHRTSLAKSCLEKWCCNQIYLSGFTDEHCKSNAVYSLETSKYHPEIYYKLKEPQNCIWIEPTLTS